jgi:electron transfer flavoprotein alpha subunit
VTDLGWRPHYEQVGQTGHKISPKLYVGIGVSGAVQHTVGMVGSETIVAVNRDPAAPIFKLATYGIVGDLFEVVPLLTEEVKRVRTAG